MLHEAEAGQTDRVTDIALRNLVMCTDKEVFVRSHVIFCQFLGYTEMNIFAYFLLIMCR
jgi:hypothetical protein